MLVPAPDIARPWRSQGTPELCPVKPPGKPAFSACGAAQLHLAQSISRKHTSECWWRLRLTARSALVLWRQFRDGYNQSFQDDSAPPGAGYMLDLIADAAFDMPGSGSLRPVSKADVFGEFMWPLDPEDWEGEVLPPKHETPESAEAALAFLVEQEMVEVAGDTITVPARFWSGGQVPAS